MEDESIENSQITASSTYSSFVPGNGRLNGNSHWEAYSNSEPYWIQIDFQVSVEISGLQVQGSSDSEEWTKTMKVEYGDTEHNLIFIEDESGNVEVTCEVPTKAFPLIR